VAGLAHSNFINASFSYFRPNELNRFNGSGRGAWYAALGTETCLAEVIFHMTRELQRVNKFETTVEYAEMFASFAGEFADLRKHSPKPDCLHPDPRIAYPAGNLFAERVRSESLNGIIYPSLRHKGGTCIVALWPHVVQSVVQGAVYRVQWNGSETPTVKKVG
jgi:hypothetical protein